MKTKDHSEAVVFLAGYVAWAAANLFRGFSVASLPLIALFTILGMCQGNAVFPLVFGFSLIGLISPVLMPWAVIVSGLLASAVCESLKIRITGFLAVTSTLWLIPLSASIPMIVLVTLLTLTGKSRLRYLLIPVGFIVSSLFLTLPVSVVSGPLVAGSEIHDGILHYFVPEVNTSRREVLIPAPFEGTWAVWIAIEAGGVRDSLPMMAIELNEELLLLPSGMDTLCFTVNPGDTLIISLMREFKPFNHSVIHAEAGGERL